MKMGSNYWIPEMIEKTYIFFCIFGSKEVCESRGQRSVPICGFCLLNFDHFWPKLGHLRYMKLYIFHTNMTIWLLLAHFHWNRTTLKIWPLYKRSMTFCCFYPYLENETSYEFHVIDFLLLTKLSNHFDYSTNLKDEWIWAPCNDPVQLILNGV